MLAIKTVILVNNGLNYNMKTIKKISLFFVLLFSTFFLQFCDRNTHPCGNDVDYDFKPTIIESYLLNTIYKYVSNNNYKNYTSDSIKMESNDTIYLGFYAIIKQAYKYTSNCLFACSPLQVPIPSPAGDSIRVFTLDDFDNTHKAGSDVTEYFIITNDSYVGGLYTREHKSLASFSSVNTEERFQVGLTVKPLYNAIRLQFKVYKNDIANAQKFETPALMFY